MDGGIFGIFLIVLFVIGMSNYVDRYHGEKFCPYCGCEIVLKWYYQSRWFDTNTGEGISKDVEKAECSKNSYDFSKYTGKKRKSIITPVCDDGDER